MLGYYASNIIEGFEKTIQWNEIDKLDKEKSLIIDVREEFELVTGGLIILFIFLLGN